jgi:hypothetical protein
MTKTSEELVKELIEIEHQERALEEDALLRLTEIRRRRYYLELGFASLFEFCEKHLGYSAGKASRRVASLKLLESVSDEKAEIVYGKLRTGALTLTHLSQLQSVATKKKLSREKKEEMLLKLEDTSTREAERVLATEFGAEAIRRETFTPVTETDTKVSLVLDLETLKLLEEFKHRTAHQNPRGSSATALKLALQIALGKKRPRPVPAPELIPASSQRLVRGKLRAAVWQQDRGRCSICGSTYMLEVDHRVPWSAGGKTELSNLRLLCRAHHQGRENGAYPRT